MTRFFTALVAALVAVLTLSGTAVVHAQNLKGNAAAGARKNAMCIGCHGIVGYQASFPQVHKVPMISGQNAGYIIAALNAYKQGDRKHPTMRGIADSLSDQDMADLAAYYSVQGKPLPAAAQKNVALTPNPAVAALLKKANCQTCHGVNLSSATDPNVPKIAGQYADYLFVALKAYQTETSNPTVGRSNPVMAGMVKPLTHAELKQLAMYLGSLPGELQVVPQKPTR